MDNLNIFGDRLRELMLDKDITSDKLASVLHLSGSTVRSWRNGTQNILLSHAILLANFFQCSLDFLFGKVEYDNSKNYKTNIPFYPRLRDVLREKNVTCYRINLETQIKDSYFSEWKKGADPHMLSIIELADYLDCSLDYLVGRDF